MNKELLRKSLHSLSFLSVFIHYYYPRLALLFLFIFASLYLFNLYFIHFHQKSLPYFNDIYLLLKRKESYDFAPFFLAIGLFLTLFFFKYPISYFAAFQVCIGDALACIIGLRWPRPNLKYSHKSIWGTLAFFASCCACALFLHFSLAQSIALSAIGAALESLPLGKVDNLFIPLAAAFLANFMR